MRLPRSAALALAAAVALGACSTARDVEQSSTSGCTTCHGFPPAQLSGSGLAHPSNANCVQCHSATVDANNEIVPGGAHMNGHVDAAGGHDIPYVAQHKSAALADLASCTACHGADYGGGSARSCTACHDTTLGFADWRTNCTFCHGGAGGGRDPSWSGNLAEAAPPQTVAGPSVEADQTNANPKVGAHQRHLVAGTYSAPLACESCHAVPPQTFLGGSLAHVDGTTDVEFSTTARQGVTTPGYAGAGGTCAVYCHGSTSDLGNNTSPAWTSTGAVVCGACHTVSPTSGYHDFHVTNRNVACAKCHPGYSVDPEGVNTATHVNGLFQASVQANGAVSKPTIDAEFSNTISTWPPNDCDGCHL